MGREIERKFLVSGGGWRSGEGVPFRQGYLSTDPHRSVRLRVAGGKAWITVKGITEGAARDEYEYEVPPADAVEMIDRLCLRPVIRKTRYPVAYGGRKWTVDVFEGENKGLVLAEVELESEDENVKLPPWAGEEVTGDGRYANAALVSRPYGTWEEN